LPIWQIPGSHLIKEEKMTKASVVTADKTKSGKRLLIYGMFALVLVTVVSVFFVTYLITAPLGAGASAAIQIALIMAVVSIVACVIVWFVYTKMILKE